MTEDPLSIVHSVVCCFISFHFASCSACHGDKFLELLLGDCEAAVLIWDWVNADMHTHSVHQTVNRQQGCKLSNNSRNTVYTLSRLLSLSLFTWQYQHIMMSLFYTSLSKILSFTGIHTKVVPLFPFLSMMERHMSWVLFHQDTTSSFVHQYWSSVFSFFCFTCIFIIYFVTYFVTATKMVMLLTIVSLFVPLTAEAAGLLFFFCLTPHPSFLGLDAAPVMVLLLPLCFVPLPYHD